MTTTQNFKTSRHLSSVILTSVELENYLKYQAAKQFTSSTAPIAHIGNSVICLTQPPSLRPWILDFGASDHISGNLQLLSHTSTSKFLSSVTLTNGSTTTAQAVGRAYPLPSLPLESVLYIPHCPFNLISICKLTRSLNCTITFVYDSVLIQDRSTGKTIGVGRESSTICCM